MLEKAIAGGLATFTRERVKTVMKFAKCLDGLCLQATSSLQSRRTAVILAMCCGTHGIVTVPTSLGIPAIPRDILVAAGRGTGATAANWLWAIFIRLK